MSPLSPLFLDEVHKWFAAKNYRDEPKYVLDMTSMHRHLQLMVYVVTQRWMNASLSFRSMSTELIRCMNYARVPLFGPLRLHSWGLNLFRVGRCLPEDYDERNDELKIGKKDISFDFEFPTFNRGVYFRLYKSHVHGGSLADQAKELRDVRAKLVGSNLIDQLEDKKNVTKKTDKRIAWLKYAMIFGVGVFVAMLLMKPEKEIVQVQVPGAGPPPKQHTMKMNTPQALQNTPPKVAPVYERYKITGVVRAGAYIGTDFIRIGQRGNEFRLEKVDVQNGKTYWENKSGDSLLWPVGGNGVVSASPKRMRPERPKPRTTGQSNPAHDQRAPNPTQHGQNRPA